jgi:hypothetical protein
MDGSPLVIGWYNDRQFLKVIHAVRYVIYILQTPDSYKSLKYNLIHGYAIVCRDFWE